MTTRLTNDLRRSTARRIIDATFRDRIARYEVREHALALRVLNRELGEDNLIRIASLPAGWLPLAGEIKIKNDDAPHSYYRYQVSNRLEMTTSYARLRFAEHVAVPDFVARGDVYLGDSSLAEYAAFAADGRMIKEEIEQLSQQVLGTLGGYYNVETFAAEWPEGYAYFPHPEMSPGTLPATRIADLNERLANAKKSGLAVLKMMGEGSATDIRSS